MAFNLEKDKTSQYRGRLIIPSWPPLMDDLTGTHERNQLLKINIVLKSRHQIQSFREDWSQPSGSYISRCFQWHGMTRRLQVFVRSLTAGRLFGEFSMLWNTPRSRSVYQTSHKCVTVADSCFITLSTSKKWGCGMRKN